MLSHGSGYLLVRRRRIMFPFLRYRFTYPGPTSEARKTLFKAISAQDRIENRSDAIRIKIFHKMPVFFYNSFNPIFCGSFSSDHRGKSQLVAYFRPNILVILFIAYFLAFPVYQIWRIQQMPDERPGYKPDWKESQLDFEYQFLGFSVAGVTLGWCLGIPYMRRILKIVDESTHANA